MCETHSKIHMHDTFKIDTIDFEIVKGGGGWGVVNVAVSNAPDRIGSKA